MVEALAAEGRVSADKPLILDVAFAGRNAVYTSVDSQSSPIENAFTLVISNPSKTDPLVPPTVHWGSESPRFKIRFVFEEPPGRGALTTKELGQDISVVPAAACRNDWQSLPRGDKLCWTVTATDDNHEVLGTGARASVTLELSRIVSQLPLSDGDDITLLYVDYANIPGYLDGTLPAVEIVKKPGPSITCFYLDPASAPPGANSGPTTPHWSTANAHRVFLNHGPDGDLPPSGSLNNPIDVTAGEQIVLTATGPAGTQIAVTRPVNILKVTRSSVALNIDVKQIVPAQDGALFVFDDADPSHCSLVSATGELSPVNLPTGSDVPTSVWTACCDGSTIYATVARVSTPTNLVTIDVATETAKTAVQLLSASPNILLPPDVAVTEGGEHLCIALRSDTENAVVADVELMDPSTFKVLSKVSLLDTAPPELTAVVAYGGMLAISPDGTKVYVAGLGGIAVFDVSTGRALGWILVPSVIPDYACWSAVVTPDATSAYIAAAPLQPDGHASLLAIRLKPEGTSLPVDHTLSFDGTGELPLALSPDGDLLYVGVTDGLLMVDTQQFSARSIVCGSGDFKPAALAVGPERNVVHAATAGSELTTVTIDGL